MQRVFTDDDFNAIVDQKKRVLAVFFVVLAVYLALAVCSLIYYTSLPYKDDMQKYPKAVMFVSTSLFVVFLFLYMGIKFHRVKKYYKMMYYLSEGLKNVEENYFVGFELNDLQKDGVDAISCVFKTWSYKKKEWMRREAYWDVEKRLPPFEEGDLVRYVVQSNFIVAYDITRKAGNSPQEERKETEVAEGAGDEA
ncbi:MAG: hypothetical protein SPH68_07735 [Candidatus Borkfalkiaceae bacterium]|nr:hypothetical protein [Clostridia bacterium]MDY6224031.1 hypothetical protein [Christensenellaceae bacterium]